MAHAPYLRAKARQLRVEKCLTIDELAERLALSRSTIYYWVRDLPIEGSGTKTAFPTHGQRLGNKAMQLKYKRLRDAAYEEGCETFDSLIADPTFRDFVCLYMAEGYKRDRNAVAICNSDPAIMVLALKWIRRFARNPLEHYVAYHADQNLDQLCRFWGESLGLAPAEIGGGRKSNSGHLAGRVWRSRHGVLTICVSDTLFRSKLEAWMDRLRSSWT
jgi:predicted DNA-binding transcriptional regulator AlpA